MDKLSTKLKSGQTGKALASRFFLLSGSAAAICLSFLSVSCKSEPLTEGAKTKQALVSEFVAALATGQPEQIRKYLIRKHEYVKAIHPHTPEAKNISGEELWETMIVRKRDVITSFLIEKFKGKSCNVTIDGEPRKFEKHGPVSFYRQTPVSIVCGDKDHLYTDKSNTIFGIIVEKYGTWKVLNIFTD